MTTSSGTKGMLSTEAARKSVLATLVDLYKSDLAFRGMLDFAVVGALVLMFLDPPGSVQWPWNPPHDQHDSGAPQPQPNRDLVGPGNNSSILPPQKPKSVAGPAIPIPFADVFKNPRVGAAFILDIDPKAFRSSSAADQPRLAAARTAIGLWRVDDAIEALREADGNDPNVALLRGAAFAMRGDAARTAEALLRQAADAGNTQAKALLGSLLLDPRGGAPTNSAEAQQLIEAGVAAGDRQAMRLAGIGYLSGEFGMLDAAKGANLFKQAADAGDAEAMAIYARLLSEGIGVGTADPAQAERYLRQSANAGLTPAQETLGNWLSAQYGAGLLPDPKEAIEWLTRAYEKGHSLDALGSLVDLHSTVAKAAPWKDIPRAMGYLRLCSGLAWAPCQYDIAIAWKHGHFGSVNYVLARAHLAAALSLGDQRAQEGLATLDKLLTPAQIAEATTAEQKIRAELKSTYSLLALQYSDIHIPLPPKVVSSELRGVAGIPNIEFQSVGSQGSGGVGTDVDALRDRAIGHFEDKNYDGAIADFTEVVKKGDATWEDYNQRGMAYHAKGQYDLAIADYTQALTKNEHADAHYNRGLVYREKGNLDDALTDFEAAIRKKNDEPNYFVALGIVHYMKSAYDLSARDLDKAIELAFKNTTMTPEGKAEYYFMRGRAKAEAASAQLRQCRTFAGARCDSSEQFMAAAADFKLALAEKSDYAPALLQLGLLASEVGDRRQAIEQYSAAIKADPNNTTAYNNRGVIYGDMGQNELAFADYNDAIRADPTNRAAWANRGVLFSNVRNRKRAIEDLRQAVAIDPNYAYAIDALRRLGVKIKRPAQDGIDQTLR